jgi:hypothetical protein
MPLAYTLKDDDVYDIVLRVSGPKTWCDNSNEPSGFITGFFLSYEQPSTT